jgi:hypothetical protein
VKEEGEASRWKIPTRSTSTERKLRPPGTRPIRH